MLVEGGIASKENLAKVDMPIGMEIKADGPYEIALSILSKLVM